MRVAVSCVGAAPMDTLRHVAAWLYKATNRTLDHRSAATLANRGFLCRPAHSFTGGWSPLVRNVGFGDVIHYYFIGRKPYPVGAFEVVRREDFAPGPQAPPAANFVGPLESSALYEVVDSTFISDLDQAHKYRPDTKLGRFTGWLLRRVGEPGPAPEAFLAGRQTLVPAPDASPHVRNSGIVLSPGAAAAVSPPDAGAVKGAKRQRHS